MDPKFTDISGLVNGFEYYDGNILPNTDQYPDLGFNIPSLGNFSQSPYFSSDIYPKNLAPSSIWSPTQESSSSPTDENDSSNPVLKYISQILMEENMEDKPCMFPDSLVLQQTEEMFYQVIGETQAQTNSPQDSAVSRGSSSTSTSTSIDTGNFVDSHLVSDPSSDSHFGLNLEFPGSSRFPIVVDGSIGSSLNEFLMKNMLSDTESVLQFKKGLEEASKFLPSGDQLMINLEREKTFSTGEMEEVSEPVLVKEGFSEQKQDLKPVFVQDSMSGNSSGARRNHKREEMDLDEIRSNKQSAIQVEDSEITEMFDKVLLLDEKCRPASHYEKELSDAEAHSKNQGKKKKEEKKKKNKKKKNDTVDFRSLLILCSQAVSSNDKITAHGLLKQIREHSSPLGDASQRLAHCFANGLEARLMGSTCMGIQNFYNSLACKETTAADILKAYKVYISASPFKTFMYFFSNKMIVDAAENASVLHIVDFGIFYGFQWPMLIQHISKRQGGAPKLRITGIEFPQPGFRPVERIEETGKRLAKYCERFGVQFEYNPIASQNWESIQFDDLKIRSNEILAVNCVVRFKNLLDETADSENCPRNAVLRLIREMNPDVFVHSTINGSYNAPFFPSRFKEALFHFSALFDMFDSTMPRENPERLMFEREFYGREAMNVIACEGLERVERPESYKQWQVRMVRAGFRQVHADRELMNKFREKLKLWNYHKDFLIDEDGDWFLQGWKGRILYASSCWVPA